MKYRVSLLPAKNRKRLIGKKKAEKAKSIALVILLVLLANVFILTVCFTVAQTEKNKIVAMNKEYEMKVASLKQYRDINTNLQNKIALIKSIQIDEPSLSNFLAILGNIDHPGVSVKDIDCSAWKSARICNITGTCTSRSAFKAYMAELEKQEGIASVSCSAYTVSIVEGETVANFAIAITCSGGSATAATTDTTQAAQ